MVSQAPRLPSMPAAFNFSSARPFIKQDLVDSTQRGVEIGDSVNSLAHRGYDMTDGASTSTSVAE